MDSMAVLIARTPWSSRWRVASFVSGLSGDEGAALWVMGVFGLEGGYWDWDCWREEGGGREGVVDWTSEKENSSSEEGGSLGEEG